MYTPALHNIYGHAQTHTHTHTHARACMHTRTYTHVCTCIHTGTHCIRRPYLSVKIGLEWSKMASNATLSHLKLKFSLGGHAPRPPSFICIIYIPLHSIYISAYTYIITALHVFYRCLGYHIYIHVPAPLLYFVITPPPPPITLLYTYNTCIKFMCISCAAVIHCNTQF